MSKEILSDHDLLTTLANDVKWMKLIITLYIVPLLLQTYAALSSIASR